MLLDRRSMKDYKIKLNLEGNVKYSYISLENDLTEDEVKEAITDYVKELFDWSYEEVIDEGY